MKHIYAKAKSLLLGSVIVLLTSVSAYANDLPTIAWGWWPGVPSLVVNGPMNYVAEVTATDSDGTIAKVEFYEGSTLKATVTTPKNGTTDTFNTTLPLLDYGTYALTAKAYDNDGGVATTSVTTVKINASPAVSITAPATNAQVAPGSNVTLTANATDSDGTIAKVEFYAGTTLVGTATSSPYTVSWSNVAAGTYSVTAKATDNDGAATTSAGVAISAVAQVGLYYIYPDHLGTPRLITDEANNVVWRNLPTTEPFGNSPPEDDPNATGSHFTFNLRYQGQYADQETNTNYNYFRDYDPSTGRYIEPDPVGLNGGQFSIYTYVNGNPLIWVDPLGLANSGPWPRPPKSSTPLPYDPKFGPQNCSQYAPGTVLRNICEGSGDQPNLNCARKCLKDRLPKDGGGNTCPIKDATQPPADWYYEDHPICWMECGVL